MGVVAWVGGCVVSLPLKRQNFLVGNFCRGNVGATHKLIRSAARSGSESGDRGEDVGQILCVPDPRNRDGPWPVFHPRKMTSPRLRCPAFRQPPPPPKAGRIFRGKFLLVALARFLCHVAAGRIRRAEELANSAAGKGEGRGIFALASAGEPSLDEPIFKRSPDQFRWALFSADETSRHSGDDLPRVRLQRVENVEVGNAAGLHFHDPPIHRLAPTHRPCSPQFIERGFYRARGRSVVPRQGRHGEPIAFRVAEGKRGSRSARRGLVADDARRSGSGRGN